MTNVNGNLIKNDLGVLDRILRKGLSPWLEENKIGVKFYSLLAEMPRRADQFAGLYDIDFYRPLNSKTEYYQKLILNEINVFCNKIKSLLDEDSDNNWQKYWCNDTQKKLESALRDVGKLISDYQYDIEHLNPYKASNGIDINHKSTQKSHKQTR